MHSFLCYNVLVPDPISTVSISHQTLFFPFPACLTTRPTILFLFLTSPTFRSTNATQLFSLQFLETAQTDATTSSKPRTEFRPSIYQLCMMATPGETTAAAVEASQTHDSAQTELIQPPTDEGVVEVAEKPNDETQKKKKKNRASKAKKRGTGFEGAHQNCEAGGETQ